MEWDYSGRKGRDGQKKKIGKANERKGKVKRGKQEVVNGQGGKGCPGPTRGDLLTELPSLRPSSSPFSPSLSPDLTTTRLRVHTLLSFINLSTF